MGHGAEESSADQWSAALGLQRNPKSSVVPMDKRSWGAPMGAINLAEEGTETLIILVCWPDLALLLTID